MMKFKKSILLFLLVSLVAFSGLSGAAAASGQNVSLIKADYFSETYGTIQFSGDVEVANLGYQKTVTIHYSTDDKNWYDTNATYVGPTDSSHEKWHFMVQTSDMTNDHPELKNSSKVDFAIKYDVNGQTYWDNNNNQNYTVKPYNADSTILGYPNVLNEENNVLISGNFYGNIYVKNFAYDKTVQILYTTDNWQTTHTANASYSSQANSDNSVEIWRAAFTVDPTVPQIKYAISYTVNGQTYWDNNYGKNYTLDAIPR